MTQAKIAKTKLICDISKSLESAEDCAIYELFFATCVTIFTSTKSRLDIGISKLYKLLLNMSKNVLFHIEI